MVDDISLRRQLGDRLRQAREKAGLSQVDLANKAGFSRGHISFLETGKRRITLDNWIRLAKACGVHPAFMFGINPSGNNNPIETIRNLNQEQKVKLLNVYLEELERAAWQAKTSSG